MGWAAVFADLDAPALMLYAGSVLGDRYDTIYALRTRRTTPSSASARRRGCSAEDTKSWLVWLYGGALVLFASAYAAAEVPARHWPACLPPPHTCGGKCKGSTSVTPTVPEAVSSRTRRSAG